MSFTQRIGCSVFSYEAYQKLGRSGQSTVGELIRQVFRFLEIDTVRVFGIPVVDWRQQVAGLYRFALAVPRWTV
jgi:hypothetical protein